MGCHGRVKAIMISQNGASKPVFATGEFDIWGDVLSAEGNKFGVTVCSSGGEVINFSFE